MLSVSGVFNAPVQLQQFSAEDIFTNENVQASETQMGVDGFLAAGFVYAPVSWAISLMADSPSNDIFDQWYQANRKAVDVYRSSGVVTLPSLGKKFNMVNGTLITYKNMPDAGKILKSRTFGIMWQAVTPATV